MELPDSECVWTADLSSPDQKLSGPTVIVAEDNTMQTDEVMVNEITVEPRKNETKEYSMYDSNGLLRPERCNPNSKVVHSLISHGIMYSGR